MSDQNPVATESNATMTELKVLLARQAITDVLQQYCYAMDRNDRELAYRVWHPGGTANYEGMFEGLGRDFVDFGIGGHETTFDGTSHQITNVAITVEGHRANSECYVTAACHFRDTDFVYLIRGRYLDSWSCREGTWGIEARRFCTDLWQIVPMNHDMMASLVGSGPSE